MSDHDLHWLAARQPDRAEIDLGARERALQALVQHGARTGARRFGLGALVRTRTFGLAAVTGAAAIAAAVVLSVAGSGGGSVAAEPALVLHHGAGSSPLVRLTTRASRARVTVHRHVAGNAPLVRLAAFVSASAAPAGDATLVARTTTGGGSSVTVYDLYADNGRYYFSPAASGLGAQVSANHDLADGLFAREIAAARLAATGDVATAAQDLADAPNPGHSISPTQTASKRTIAAKEKATGVPQEGNLYDNWVWENAQDALVAGAGDPQVRAGVLRILATLPGVTVANGSFGSHSTLVLTAGGQELGYGYTEQLTIDADTGVPLQFVGGSTGGQHGTVDYQVSRVSLADPLASLSSGTGSSD
jgi:hypothetical protein